MSEGLVIYREAALKIKAAILHSRYRAASVANAEQLALYYGVGGYISANTREGTWGTGAIEEVSKQLQVELPGLHGFSSTSMKYMRLFYEAWSVELSGYRHLSSDDIPTADIEAIRHLSSDELAQANKMAKNASHTVEAENIEAFLRVGFTHHREILAKCKDWGERWYYIKRCAAEFWTVESLKSHIKAGDYKRYGTLPNNFALTLPDDKTVALAVHSFKDMYWLDFVNIEEEVKDEYVDERVLSHEIVHNISKFIMALGKGFTFIGEGHRLLVGDEEYFVDLLLFNRDLNCLVAIELKSGKFKPSYLGQLSFYLSALDKYEKKPQENKTIGLLLCKDASKASVELAIQDYNKPMGVATYTTAKDIPDAYKALAPVVDGVKGILAASDWEPDLADDQMMTKTPKAS
jgi:predicted nuclease of restriction endonuclease-like (RecB) superfamily